MLYPNTKHPVKEVNAETMVHIEWSTETVENERLGHPPSKWLQKNDKWKIQK